MSYYESFCLNCRTRFSSNIISSASDYSSTPIASSIKNGTKLFKGIDSISLVKVFDFLITGKKSSVQGIAFTSVTLF